MTASWAVGRALTLDRDNHIARQGLEGCPNSLRQRPPAGQVLLARNRDEDHRVLSRVCLAEVEHLEPGDGALSDHTLEDLDDLSSHAIGRHLVSPADQSQGTSRKSVSANT